MLKIMSKMGISTIRSYRGAKLFNTLGLAQEVLDRYFGGGVSPIAGIGIEDITAEALAAHARDTGHVAIQMSGATQLLFGIKGRRWDTHPQISKLYNPAWVRPAPAEQPANKQAVEGGSYW